MKVLIIEDEQLAAAKLEKQLKKIDDGILILNKLRSIKSSIEWLQLNSPDLIFCDIQLIDGNSFEIFEKVQPTAPIIFTTAYDNYAINAFKLNSIDYLLKPISNDELEKAINKYKSLKLPYNINLNELLNSLNPQSEFKKRFLIQYGNKIKSVNVEDIAFFYFLEKNTFLVTKEKDTYPVEFSLDKLEEIIDPDKFFRINRKIIVNIDAINNLIPYSRSRIKIELLPQPPKEVEAIVSIEKSFEFKKWLGK